VAPARSCAPVELRFAQRTLPTAIQIPSTTRAHVVIAWTTACIVCAIAMTGLRCWRYSARFSNQMAESANAPAAKAAAHQIMATLGTDAGENGDIDTWDMTGG
jgi:hypothetical protein